MTGDAARDARRLEAEEARRQSEDWRLTLMAASPLGIVVTDPESKVLLWNRAAEKLFGWADTDVLGRRAPFIPQDKPEEEEACSKAVLRGQVYTSETQRLCRDGSLVDVRLTASPMSGKGGEVARILSFFEDITERKRVARMLAEQTKLMELIASGSNIEDSVIAVTKAAARLLPGVQAAVLRADEKRTAIGFVRGAGVSAQLREVIRGLPVGEDAPGICGRAIFSGQAVTCADISGDRHWSQLWRDAMLAHGVRACHSTPVFQRDGTAVASFLLCFPQIHEPDEYDRAIGRFGAHIVGIALEQHRSAISIRESEERFRMLGMATSDVIYEMSADWSSVRHLYGRGWLADAGDTTATWMDRYICPEDREFIEARIRTAIQKRETFELEHRVRQADGSIGWTFSRAVPLINAAGELAAWFGAASDITSRKRAEQAMMKTEKLAAAGRMAATVAHEINNPLESIANLLYLARQDSGMSEESRKYLQTAAGELDRASHVVKQTLGYYRDSAAASWIRVSEVTADLIRMFRHKQKGREILLEQRGSQGWDQARVFAPEGEFRQVLSNLISNAIDATAPESGRIHVRVRSAGQSGARAPDVRITIADNGGGIERGSEAKIFEAFFTTKQDVGTGLGLWVTSTILKKHGARIRMRSRTVPGSSGTIFSIFWPAAGRSTPLRGNEPGAA